MLVVAEYVETEEIRSAVHALGIDYVQGYLIGRPEARVTAGGRGVLDGRLSRYAATSALFFDFEQPAGDRFPVLLLFSRSSRTSAFWLNQSCGKLSVQ